jgi:predicted RNA-binding Zn ribbon-like protein
MTTQAVLGAPGELELVRAFVNSNDIDAGTDELGSPSALLDWLVGHDLADPSDAVSDDDLRRAVGVREALRTLLLCNNDGKAPDPAAIDTLNHAGARARLAPRFDERGVAALDTESRGVDGALDRILAIVYGAMEAGTWSRLKACRNDTCCWGFYDRSKNHSRTWCSMDVCGSQMKARAYRRRRKARAQ